MDGASDYIALAIPVFFLLIGLELLVARLRKTQLYRFSDSVTNISCGIGSQVTGVFLKTVLFLAYVVLHEEFALLELDAGKWWVWLVLFLGVDFFYYWFHRYAHEISVMWGTHIVHHQSEEYNLSVALRQSAFQSIFSTAFYLPLAVIGFDPITFLIVNQFQTLYQFWIHTKAIDKLHPAFEYIFNTPSHHRVHHGQNPKYIDRNHGGTLIIWDRLFGTFQAEEEEVVYGITKPLNSWNPVWANLEYYRDALQVARKTRSIGDFIRVFTKPPGWRPEYLGGPIRPREVSAQTFQKFDVPVTPDLSYFVLFQYVILLLGTSVFLFSGGKLLDQYGPVYGWLWQAGLGGLIVVSIATLGGLLERKRWAIFGEAGRLLGIAATVPALFLGTELMVPVTAGLAIYTVVSLLWMFIFLPAVKLVLVPEK